MSATTSSRETQRHRAMRHYKRALQALRSGKLTGLSAEERRQLIAHLHKALERLHPPPRSPE